LHLVLLLLLMSCLLLWSVIPVSLLLAPSGRPFVGLFLYSVSCIKQLLQTGSSNIGQPACNAKPDHHISQSTKTPPQHQPHPALQHHSLVQDEQGVVLPVCGCSHVPRELVLAILDVLKVLFKHPDGLIHSVGHLSARIARQVIKRRAGGWGVGAQGSQLSGQMMR